MTKGHVLTLIVAVWLFLLYEWFNRPIFIPGPHGTIMVCIPVDYPAVWERTRVYQCTPSAVRLYHRRY